MRIVINPLGGHLVPANMLYDFSIVVFISDVLQACGEAEPIKLICNLLVGINAFSAHSE
ncbi:MAG: hypothetical protein WBP22_02475 [Candidatus Saccharimonas sp.]